MTREHVPDRPIWRAGDFCDACKGLDGQRVPRVRPPHPLCSAPGGCRCTVETTLQETS